MRLSMLWPWQEREAARPDVSERFTREDSEHLADIIWWIKGYRAGCEADLKLCPFDHAHVEALRKARVNLDNHGGDR